MKSNFFRSSSILKQFLVLNLIIFLILGIFTFLYLSALEPNLIKKRSSQHEKIINNTSNHIKRLNVEFTKESVTKFLEKHDYIFHNLDRVQFYDLNSNLLADTDTLDLVQDVFVPNQDVEETSIDKSDENLSAEKSDETNQTKIYCFKSNLTPKHTVSPHVINPRRV